jgi:hypothetical protein
VDAQHHLPAVDIAHLEVCAFEQSESASIDRRQTNAVDRNPDRSQNATDFFAAEDDRQVPLPRWPDKAERGPVPLQGMFEKKLDPA